MCRNLKEVAVAAILFCWPLVSQPRQALDRETVVSWLPTDTETLIVASRPFVLPPNNDSKTDRLSLTTVLQSVTVSEIIGYEKVYKSLVGRSVVFAVEGSRNFRWPSGLGMAPYDGATIVVFAESVHNLVDTFVKGVAHEDILGSQIYTFSRPNPEAPRDKPEEFKLFLAHPLPNVIVGATDRGYLRVLLERMQQKKPDSRALPAGLPEWKYVDINAPVWAVRHYRRELNSQDVSSPFRRGVPAEASDQQAVGLVFCSQPQGKDQRIYYLSDNKKSVSISRFYWEREGLNPTLKQKEPGAMEIDVPVNSDQEENSFLFLLLNALGHAIFL
jgi:hypothetical protein